MWCGKCACSIIIVCVFKDTASLLLLEEEEGEDGMSVFIDILMGVVTGFKTSIRWLKNVWSF